MLASLPLFLMSVSPDFRLGVALSVGQALDVATVIQGVTLSGFVLKVNGTEVTSGVPGETSRKPSVTGELKSNRGVARVALPGVLHSQYCRVINTRRGRNKPDGNRYRI